MDEIALAKSSVKYAGWISMVEACQNSGLPVRVWCKANHIGYKTYYYRLRKLRGMFLEQHKEEVVQQIEPLPVVHPEPCISTVVTIHFEGMSVDIPNGASEETISTILRAVKSTW